MAEEDTGVASKLSPSEVFDAEGEAAYHALTSKSANAKDIDSVDDSFALPILVSEPAPDATMTTGQAEDDEDFVFDNPSKPEAEVVNSNDAGFDLEEEEKDDAVPDGGLSKDRVSAYAMKKRRLVVVYGPAQTLQQRSDFVTRLTVDLPDVYFLPDAVCTAQRNPMHYGGGHPCVSVTADAFAERTGSGDFFAAYQLPMRRPQETPKTVASTPPPGASRTAVGSPVRGSESPSVSSLPSTEDQPRRRRQLPSVPSTSSAAASAPAPTPATPSVSSLVGKPPAYVQVAVLKESVEDSSQPRGKCGLLSLDSSGAVSVAKNSCEHHMGFIMLAKDKAASTPFSSEHTVIVVQDSDGSFNQFRNAALVAASQTPGRAFRPSSVSQVELEARTEWEAVANVRLGSTSQADLDSSLIADPPPRPLDNTTFAEALAHFQSQQRSLQAQFGIFTPLKKPGLLTTKLKASLVPERELVYTIANTPFDNNNPLHFRVLQTIYKKLTGNIIDCPRFGSHWQSIGFQGTDPATDLRATGLLSLLHMLHLVETPDLLPLALNVFKLSNDEEQNFPFAILLINLTLFSLQALEIGAVSKMCNKRQQVVSCVNDMFAGCLFRLYTIWKTGRKTIVDSSAVLNDLQSLLNNHPRQLLADLERHLSKQRRSDSREKRGSTSV